MNSTKPAERTASRPLHRLAEPSGWSAPRTRRSRWRSVAAFAWRAVFATDHDETTFVHLENVWYAGKPPFTTARDEQVPFELVGPPPLGL